MLVVSGAVCGACGSGITPANSGDRTTVKIAPPPADAAPTPAASAENFLMSYDAKFDGLLPAGGSFKRAVPRSAYKNCLDYLVRSDDRFFGVIGDVNGHHFELSVELRVHGPGTYTPVRGASADIDFDSSDERYNFQPPDGRGATEISIFADGSGKLTFSGWENSSQEKEAGSISWRCR